MGDLVEKELSILIDSQSEENCVYKKSPRWGKG